jgi:hypothetical protein
MPLITLVPEEQAEGKLLELYETERRTMGYVPNYTKAFSLRPDIYEIWGQLIKTIRSKMRFRRYELVTIAAASTLGCTY